MMFRHGCEESHGGRDGRVFAGVWCDWSLWRDVSAAVAAVVVWEARAGVVVMSRVGRYDWVWPLVITLEVVGFLFLSWLREQ